MLRCALLVSALSAVAFPAAAQRTFPATALRGEFVVVQPPDVRLNGKPARLAPGARIRNETNMVQLSGSLVGQKRVVNYTIDPQGELHDVWILTGFRGRAEAVADHAAGSTDVGFRSHPSALGQAMKKVFIKTFGCQMNEYDSDKMADVLREAEGYEPTTDVAAADLILFNTCSVREKAQEKVFSDLGRVKHLKKNGALIGVGGCVASQEGAAIVARAPYVDIVFGPQTLHRLPQLLEARRRTDRPQVDISFPEIEKFDHLPPARVDGPSAFVSIMEGCSKYCSYCVVPYTRGEEVSRRFDDVLTEIAGLADQGVKEVTLLGQNVNAYRGAMEGTRRVRRFRVAAGVRARRSRHRTHPLHHEPPQRVHAPADRGLRTAAQARQPPAPAGSARQRPHPRGDEARLHRARVQEHRCAGCGPSGPSSACPAISSSASPARRTTISSA